MQLTFAGQNLLLEDPEGAVQNWLDTYIPIEDLRIVSRWLRMSWNSFNTVYPNYSDPPRPKLNTWYRPTGASRWAFGLFLTNTAGKNAIQSAIGSTNAAGTLRAISDTLGARSWQAYMLPPHPVSADIGYSDDLWIIPLVDERWYWQFIDAGGAMLTDSSTWSALFASLATALGITLNVDTIPAAYGTPNVEVLNAGNRTNAPAILDAAAHSVGQRVLLQYLGNGGNGYTQYVYQSCNFATSNTRRSRNFSIGMNGALQQGTTTTGLNLGALVPETLQIVFRKWANGIIWHDEYHTVTASASNYTSLGYTKGLTRSIQTTALADFTTGSGTPDNATDVNNLAAQIASDFYASQSWVQDSIYFDVHQWIETGYDDFVEFQFGMRRKDGSYACQVRVHTAPYNFGVATMLHQLANTHEYSDIVEGKLDGNLTPDSTATLSVWEGSPRADSGRNVVVTDRLHQWIPAGSWIVARQIEKEWRVLEMRKHLICYTSGAHNKGVSQSVKVYAGSTPGSETDTGVTVTAYNGFCNLANNRRCHVEPLENGYHIYTGDPTP